MMFSLEKRPPFRKLSFDCVARGKKGKQMKGTAKSKNPLSWTPRELAITIE